MTKASTVDSYIAHAPLLFSVGSNIYLGFSVHVITKVTVWKILFKNTDALTLVSCKWLQQIERFADAIPQMITSKFQGCVAPQPSNQNR